MTSTDWLRPDRDSTAAIRFGLGLYVVGLAGPIAVGSVGPPKVAGALLAFAALGWYFVAAFTVLDRLYLDAVEADWRPDQLLAVGCLIPFLNVFSGYFYLEERARYVPVVVDLERYGDETQHGRRR